MTYRVSTSTEADQDLLRIYEWLQREGAGETGARWIDRFEEAIASLRTSPRRCALAPENENFPFELRQLLYGRSPHIYRVLFTIDGDAVLILSIHHGRRLPLLPH